MTTAISELQICEHTFQAIDSHHATPYRLIMKTHTVLFLNRKSPPHIFTLVLLAGLSAMNMSVLLPSLPGLTTYFHSDYAVMQLAVSGYFIFTGALQLMLGPLSDRFGRRPVILWSIAVFMAATLGCLFSTSDIMFLTFRMLAGAIASGLVLSRAIVRDMVSADEAASKIGYVTMGMSIVPMIAPMIGGALDLAYGWQAVCLFMLAMGGVIGAIIWADLGETKEKTQGGLAAQMREFPELLSSMQFWGYALTTAFGSGSFFAFLGGGPLIATAVFNMSPFWTGVGMGTPAIGYAVGNYLSGRYSVHIGINKMALIGAGLTAAGLTASLLISLAGFGSALTFFAFCYFVGLGNGLLIPNATAGMLSVRPHLAGTASGLGATIMVWGGALLSGISGTILNTQSSLPLQEIMALTAFASIAAIWFVIAREHRII
jgi:DHA1 family bicyclomycin/chloramphenicol resistance-like MFS transporter